MIAGSVRMLRDSGDKAFLDSVARRIQAAIWLKSSWATFLLASRMRPRCGFLAFPVVYMQALSTLALQ